MYLVVAAVDVLKKIARGDFTIPSYLPVELQVLLLYFSFLSHFRK